MKKRILFIAPDHYGFYKVILNGLEAKTNCSTTFLCSNKRPYKYKNFFERILNFFYKVLFNYNLKARKREYAWNETLDNIGNHDILFIIRPDLLNETQLKKLTKKCKHSIVFYWDSFEKITSQKNTLSFFDSKYSFDKKDCITYGLQEGHNFYFSSKVSNKTEYDVLFLGTYDKRYKELLRVLDLLKDSDLKPHAKLFLPSKEMKLDITRPEISTLTQIIPFDKSLEISSKGAIILDIHHENQDGLSFRPFEAMGLEKKLITTNTKITEYDFYDPNNIFVITANTNHIPKTFLNTPYKQIPQKLFEKYSREEWINKFVLQKHH